MTAIATPTSAKARWSPKTVFVASIAHRRQSAWSSALDRLASVNPRAAEVVGRRLDGMAVPEIAAAMDLPEETVRRDWTVARALLRSWALQ